MEDLLDSGSERAPLSFAVRRRALLLVLVAAVAVGGWALLRPAPRLPVSLRPVMSGAHDVARGSVVVDVLLSNEGSRAVRLERITTGSSVTVERVVSTAQAAQSAVRRDRLLQPVTIRAHDLTTLSLTLRVPSCDTAYAAQLRLGVVPAGGRRVVVPTALPLLVDPSGTDLLTDLVSYADLCPHPGTVIDLPEGAGLPSDLPVYDRAGATTGDTVLAVVHGDRLLGVGGSVLTGLRYVPVRGRAHELALGRPSPGLVSVSPDGRYVLLERGVDGVFEVHRLPGLEHVRTLELGPDTYGGWLGPHSVEARVPGNDVPATVTEVEPYATDVETGRRSVVPLTLEQQSPRGGYRVLSPGGDGPAGNCRQLVSVRTTQLATCIGTFVSFSPDDARAVVLDDRWQVLSLPSGRHAVDVAQPAGAHASFQPLVWEDATHLLVGCELTADDPDLDGPVEPATKSLLLRFDAVSGRVERVPTDLPPAADPGAPEVYLAR